MKVILAPEALDDLRNIATWIAEDNPIRAQSFSRELRDKCASLSQNARRFRIVRRVGDHDIRKCNHRHYLIFYRVIASQVEILHVLHGSRDWDAIFAKLP